ncbi:DNA (cytosine-5-)-methyltransferase [Pedobacter sp. WC2501]|uniref:DNA (cytosine-5-)-methyltransferase n=1 Tax=Pedobacter sp. WC2501 TaxID=3461400 RepID=UPI004045227E
MVIKDKYSLKEVSNVLNKSMETLRRWDRAKKLVAHRDLMSNYRYYYLSQLIQFEEFQDMTNSTAQTKNTIMPKADHQYTVLELFAGAGGLAIGLEKAGLKCLALNELDKYAVKTLQVNRPKWNVIPGDIRDISFTEYRDKVDVVTGGFPCQAFSYAGKRFGFDDARGTLFYEFARTVQETNPKICIGENVKGLQNHDSGRTLKTMIAILDEIGYRVVDPKVLRAIFYNVPQKRERLILVGIRKDIDIDFEYPQANKKVYNLRDALKAGSLFDSDVPADSPGTKYPASKKAVLDLVPPGGYWRDLPLEIQKQYMQKSFFLGGGKTGMARRISWDEPSLTLTCSPAQKQTERCHPDHTRPFTVREYARIQTFPDDWEFQGPVSAQYKQIGNAVPVNLAAAIGGSLVTFLNKVYAEQVAQIAELV